MLFPSFLNIWCKWQRDSSNISFLQWDSCSRVFRARKNRALFVSTIECRVLRMFHWRSYLEAVVMVPGPDWWWLVCEEELTHACLCVCLSETKERNYPDEKVRDEFEVRNHYCCLSIWMVARGEKWIDLSKLYDKLLRCSCSQESD